MTIIRVLMFYFINSGIKFFYIGYILDPVQARTSLKFK